MTTLSLHSNPVQWVMLVPRLLCKTQKWTQRCYVSPGLPVIKCWSGDLNLFAVLTTLIFNDLMFVETMVKWMLLTAPFSR